MAYNEQLASRVRRMLSPQKGVSEKKMFGGLSFLLNGKMCCGVLGDTLVVRVGPDRYKDALAKPHVRPMDFTGRPLKGFVCVDSGGCKTSKTLTQWVKLGMDYAASQEKG